MKKQLTEAQMRQYLKQVISETIQDEGLWGNIKNAIGKGITNAYTQGGGMKDAWSAGKEQFKNLQQTDKNIGAQKKAQDAYNLALQKREQAQQAVQQAKANLAQAEKGVRQAMAAMSNVSKGMGKDNYKTAKGANAQGMDANQLDRANRQRQQVAESIDKVVETVMKRMMND